MTKKAAIMTTMTKNSLSGDPLAVLVGKEQMLANIIKLTGVTSHFSLMSLYVLMASTDSLPVTH